MTTPDFELRLTLGSLVTAGSVLGAAWAVIRTIKKAVKPFTTVYREHSTLKDDYGIRTDCDDVHPDKITGLRKPDEFYRKHPEALSKLRKPPKG